MSVFGVFHTVDFSFQRMIGADENTVFLDVGDLTTNGIEFS